MIKYFVIAVIAALLISLVNVAVRFICITKKYEGKEEALLIDAKLRGKNDAKICEMNPEVFQKIVDLRGERGDKIESLLKSFFIKFIILALVFVLLCIYWWQRFESCSLGLSLINNNNGLVVFLIVAAIITIAMTAISSILDFNNAPAIIFGIIFAIAAFIGYSVDFYMACNEKLQSLPFEESTAVEYIIPYKTKLAPETTMRHIDLMYKQTYRDKEESIPEIPSEVYLLIDSFDENIVYSTEGKKMTELYVKGDNYKGDYFEIIEDSSETPRVEIVTYSRQFSDKKNVIRKERIRFITIYIPKGTSYGALPNGSDFERTVVEEGIKNEN